MRTLNNIGITVPGGFRYFVEETKSWVPATGAMPSYVDFIYAVKKHFIANNLPIGSQFEANIQDQICATLDGDWCLQDGYPVPPIGGFGFDIASVIQGTRTLAQWLLKGKGKKVEKPEAERRAAICVACPMNQNPVGCTNCTMSALKEAAIVVVGGASTSYDAQLQSCRVCGCVLKAKIHLPLDILRDNLADTQMNALPNHCWLK